ncbi:LysR family transcriptional regulator (plasmid) [Paracoccus sp. TD-10]|uniref:LysR family transcriptional regulator n=1 Tax=Paracoccus TaxID=265 RepID=UPI000E0943F6|nr:LysR family transcriptional regulator [Paracoccus pantotrophus]RDD94642.1 LysR family transcriptional regulator [Paracoccus pantotrophus]WGR66708.1 LysR family transcriptional regulator [Paracoccus pantotrophus]
MRQWEETPLWNRPVQWTASGLPFDLRAVRYVLAASELLSFSKVAYALDARVSTVSRSIRDLEDSLGVSLFQRSTMGVRLTDAGARFLDNVLPAIIQIEAAIQHAGSAGRVEDGVVRVGILTTLAGGFLRDLVEAWRGAFDGVGLQIRDGGRREHLRAIRARDLDIVFLTGNGRIEDCDQIELWQERVHVALPEAHPLAQEGRLDWQQLKGEHFIVPSQEPGLCCTNPVWDSSHESSVVAGIHEQTYTPDLQDQELASLQ